MTPAIRMQRQRKARQAKGLIEARFWLSRETLNRLDSLRGPLSRADKVTEMVFAAYVSEETVAESVGWIREAAHRITGGNCTFVDDDLKVLEALAYSAVIAGETGLLNEDMSSKAKTACAKHPYAGVSEETK